MSQDLRQSGYKFQHGDVVSLNGEFMIVLLAEDENKEVVLVNGQTEMISGCPSITIKVKTGLIKTLVGRMDMDKHGCYLHPEWGR